MACGNGTETKLEILDNTWVSLPDVGHLKISFEQLRVLWGKYGSGYTRWFESLKLAEAVGALCESKHRFLNSLTLSGMDGMKHVPSPAGIALNKNCLLPELQTWGPCLDGLNEEQAFEETQVVSGWLAFIRSRTDPACFSNDVLHCQGLYDLGVEIPTRISGKFLGNRPFCVDGKAATVFDPKHFPSRIFLLPSSDLELSSESSSATQELKIDETVRRSLGIETVQWPNASVYNMSLLRMDYLTTFVFVSISNYRFGLSSR